jgi:hypothetical protein
MHRRWVQRKADGHTAASRTAIPEGGGAALAEADCARMERHLGADLSGVRIHTGGDSARAASDLGARAFTVDQDIHFNAGQYRPGSVEGDRLLAHELTHTVQGHKAGVQRKATDQSEREDDLEVSDPADAAEREADDVADRVASAPDRAAAPSIDAHDTVGKLHRSPEGEGEGAEGKQQAGNDPVPPGTEIWVQRPLGYHHAAIYVGNGEVVEVQSEPQDAARELLEHGQLLASVQRVPLAAFLKGGALQPGPDAPAFPPDVVVQRAMSRVGEPWPYNPVTHNCQHFASWCVSGSSNSPEAEAFEGAVQNLAQKLGTGARQLGQQAGQAAEGALHSAEQGASGLLNRGRQMLGI